MESQKYTSQEDFARHVVEGLRESADKIEKAITEGEKDQLPVSAVRIVSMKEDVSMSIGGSAQDIGVITPRVCEHIANLSPINALILLAGSVAALKELYPTKQSLLEAVKKHHNLSDPKVLEIINHLGGDVIGSETSADSTSEFDPDTPEGQKAQALVAQALKNLGGK